MRKEAMTIAEWLERKGERRGRAEGEKRGFAKGAEIGRIEDKQEVLIRLVERKFGITEEERKSIRSHMDPDALDAALDAIVTARTKATVLRHLLPTGSP
jgi:predicted transposase YdaD